MSKELSRRSFLKGAAAAAVLGVTGLPSVKAKAAASYTPGTYTATATALSNRNYLLPSKATVRFRIY